jgi:hypothetical protein
MSSFRLQAATIIMNHGKAWIRVLKGLLQRQNGQALPFGPSFQRSVVSPLDFSVFNNYFSAKL